MECKYCGATLPQYVIKKRWTVCAKCREKARILPRFVKARDNVRIKLGLERLGANDK